MQREGDPLSPYRNIGDYFTPVTNSCACLNVISSDMKEAPCTAMESDDNVFPNIDVKGRALVVGPTLVEISTVTTGDTVEIDKHFPINGHSRLRWAGGVAIQLRNSGLTTDLMTLDDGDYPTFEIMQQDMVFGEGEIIEIVDSTYAKPKLLSLTTHTSYKRISKDLFLQDCQSLRNKTMTKLEQVMDTGTYSLVIVLDFGHGLFSNEMLKRILNLGKRKLVPILTDLEDSIMDTEDRDYKKTEVYLELQDGKSLSHRKDEGVVIYFRNSEPFNFDTMSIDENYISLSAYALTTRLPVSKFSSALVSQVGGSSELTKTALCPVKLVKKYGRVIYSMEGVVALKDLMTRTRSTIALTTGCFDIFHAGHAAMLEEAKTRADVLIVLLNSDISIKLLKGDTRPFCTLKERLYILLALHSVDFVVVFDDVKPTCIVDTLDPDVFVKGPDYTVDRLRKSFPLLKHVHISQQKFNSHTSCIAERCKNS